MSTGVLLGDSAAGIASRGQQPAAKMKVNDAAPSRRLSAADTSGKLFDGTLWLQARPSGVIPRQMYS